MKSNILTVMKNAFGGNYNSVSSRHGGWLPFISEPFAGAWQRNMEVTKEDMLSTPAVFACISLIANDISKLGIQLVKLDNNGIWTETTNSAYTPVLRKPNDYQNRIQFFQSWIYSVLISGNSYILKQRDNRNVVVALYVLDPLKVIPAVADDGSVWYDIPSDELSGTNDGRNLRIPASEIIHDRANTFYHPLIGVSPLYAAAMSVGQGREIQRNSAAFFKNNSRPGGILEAEGAISDETAEQLRRYWSDNYTGNNAGKVAVLADGLKYKSFETINAQNSQVIEQLNWAADVVCSVFHVPPYKIGFAAPPNGGSLETENIRYFSEALQIRIESMQILLHEGLNLSDDLNVVFNLDDLFKMDTKTLIEAEEIAVGAGIKKLNESRKKLNLSPMDGGDTAYLQQQNYSVSALAKRDTSEDPFGKNKSSSNSSNSNDDENQDNKQEQDVEDIERFISEFKIKAAERFVTYE
jgi:HK97 family phage portal protein